MQFLERFVCDGRRSKIQARVGMGRISSLARDGRADAQRGLFPAESLNGFYPTLDRGLATVLWPGKGFLSTF